MVTERHKAISKRIARQSQNTVNWSDFHDACCQTSCRSQLAKTCLCRVIVRARAVFRKTVGGVYMKNGSANPGVSVVCLV